MSSFSDIMKEQQSEMIYNHHISIQDQFESDLLRAIAESLGDSDITVVNENSQDTIVNIDNDEKLARMLQEEETVRYAHENKYVNVKELTLYETEVLNARSEYVYDMYDDEDSVDEFELYYDEVEPRGDDEDSDDQLFVFDSAQRVEDQEISKVSKVHFSKRVNAVPTPLHHKEFATRQGKGHRGMNKKRKQEMPVKSEGFVYGRVFNVLGGRRFDAIGQDGDVYACNTLKKAEHVAMESIVLIRLREYQPGKGDIVYTYTLSDIETLHSTNEISQQDFYIPELDDPSD